jgi:DNA repair exonuclease SbcCD ATPase subunit
MESEDIEPATSRSEEISFVEAEVKGASVRVLDLATSHATALTEEVKQLEEEARGLSLSLGTESDDEKAQLQEQIRSQEKKLVASESELAVAKVDYESQMEDLEADLESTKKKLSATEARLDKISETLGTDIQLDDAEEQMKATLDMIKGLQQAEVDTLKKETVVIETTARQMGQGSIPIVSTMQALREAMKAMSPPMKVDEVVKRIIGIRRQVNTKTRRSSTNLTLIDEVNIGTVVWKLSLSIRNTDELGREVWKMYQSSERARNQRNAGMLQTEKESVREGYEGYKFGAYCTGANSHRQLETPNTFSSDHRSLILAMAIRARWEHLRDIGESVLIYRLTDVYRSIWDVLQYDGRFQDTMVRQQAMAFLGSVLVE